MRTISIPVTIASLLFYGLAFSQAPSIEERRLPGLLRTSSGKKITTVAQWESKRRAEILELFRENIYGRTPVGRPSSLKFTVSNRDPKAMSGLATLKEVYIEYTGPGGKGGFNLVLFTPNKVKPAPAFLFICNRGKDNIDPTRKKRSDFWPAEKIIERGYAAAAFYNGEIDPDRHDRFKDGIHGIFGPLKREGDSWATIAAWAWGASRAMDYLESDKDIDPHRVAVVGHSRGGKTSLWAGAEDQRFAMVVSNDSGSTGAALARGKVGEQVSDINKRFPHWFCDNYKRYGGRPNELPVDQHQLIALSAPRPVYIASASKDSHADPVSEFLAGVAASPVYELYELKGLYGDFPQPGTDMHSGHIGYHLREGGHDLTSYDWERFMNFADKRLKAKSASRQSAHSAQDTLP
jgi:dienelactone hydrolase